MCHPIPVVAASSKVIEHPDTAKQSRKILEPCRTRTDASTQHDAEARDGSFVVPRCAHHLAILRPGRRIQNESDGGAEAESAYRANQKPVALCRDNPREKRYAKR